MNRKKPNETESESASQYRNITVDEIRRLADACRRLQEEAARVADTLAERKQDSVRVRGFGSVEFALKKLHSAVANAIAETHLPMQISELRADYDAGQKKSSGS